MYAFIVNNVFQNWSGNGTIKSFLAEVGTPELRLQVATHTFNSISGFYVVVEDGWYVIHNPRLADPEKAGPKLVLPPITINLENDINVNEMENIVPAESVDVLSNVESEPPTYPNLITEMVLPENLNYTIQTNDITVDSSSIVITNIILISSEPAPEYPIISISYPTTDTPTAPASEAPATEAPASEAPASEATASEAPASEAPATEAPATEAPASEAPASEAPATEAPASEAPTTEAPASEAPASEAPASEAPASEAPASEAPAS